MTWNRTANRPMMTRRTAVAMALPCQANIPWMGMIMFKATMTPELVMVKGIWLGLASSHFSCKGPVSTPSASDDDPSSEITPSSELTADEDDDDEADTPKVVPRLRPTQAAASADDTKRSPRKKKRGEIPDNGGLIIPYADLKNTSSFIGRDDVDLDSLECHLSDAEFTKVFSLTKAKFYGLPGWRQSQLKKEKGL